MSFSLPSSPTTAFPPIDNSQSDSVLVRTHLSRFGSDKVTAQCTDLHNGSGSDSDSGFAGEAGELPDPRHAASTGASKSSPAASPRFAFPPSPTEVPIFQKSEDGLTWTKKKLRSNSGQAVKIRQEPPAETQNIAPKTKKKVKKKASTLHQSSPVPDHTGCEPLVVLINQIGQTNTIADIQESVRQPKARKPHQIRNPSEGLQSRTPIHIDTPPARIVDSTPYLARKIENSFFNDQLSRVYNRMALANFYCAYRAAHAKPYAFLQKFDRRPSQYIHRFRARNRTKRAEIKNRFIELVFCRSTRERDRKKDFTCVNNWQKAGRPWFELINRFGTGILLLVPEKWTKCRQVSHHNI